MGGELAPRQESEVRTEVLFESGDQFGAPVVDGLETAGEEAQHRRLFVELERPTCRDARAARPGGRRVLDMGHRVKPPRNGEAGQLDVGGNSVPSGSRSIDTVPRSIERTPEVR